MYCGALAPPDLKVVLTHGVVCTHASDTVLWGRRHCSHAGAGEAHLPVNTTQEWRAISMTIASVDFTHCALCREGGGVGECNNVTPSGQKGCGNYVL